MKIGLTQILYFFSFLLFLNSVLTFRFYKNEVSRYYLNLTIAVFILSFQFIIFGSSGSFSELSLFAAALFVPSFLIIFSIGTLNTVNNLNLVNTTMASVVIYLVSLFVYEVSLSFKTAVIIINILNFLLVSVLVFNSKKQLLETFKIQSSRYFYYLILVWVCVSMVYPFIFKNEFYSIVYFASLIFIVIGFNLTLPFLVIEQNSLNYENTMQSQVSFKTLKITEEIAELQKLNHDNSILLSMVCHDISTPISIARYSMTKLTSQLSFFSTENADCIKKIEKNLINISLLLKKVKDMHSLRLGKETLSINLVDISPLILEVIEMFQPLCEDKNIKINLIKNTSGLALALIDPVLLKNQVLGNLISNAIKFSKKDSTIDIILSEINNELQIEIKDHGLGIKPEKINYLFDLDKKTTTRGSQLEAGTGLGLPIVKMVTEKMGGRVQVKSFTENVHQADLYQSGTSFYVSFQSQSKVET